MIARGPSSGMASKLFLTTSAVSLEPSLNVTPGRRWKVNVRASSPTSQRSASHGTILPVAGSWSVSESTIWRTE